MRTPSALSESISGAMGRSRMRGDAVDLVDAVAECHHGRQEARGRARIADKSARAGGLDATGQPAHAERAGALVGLDPDTELAQRLGHVERVVAEQRAAQQRLAARKRRDDERAVGVALGADHLDRGVDGARVGHDRPGFAHGREASTGLEARR